ncbi:tetratricopeptide repeat protein [Streptomyces sp. NPDC057617]|uniref:tetratricopeptide repeat protein n=1 Tax=Streptomyces sp. NPDC057617 TaxID=3346184 RepID=UPI0036BC00B5
MAAGDSVGQGTRNEVSGGVMIGPLVMGRDVTVELPAQVPPALNGLRPGTSQFVGREVVLRELLDVLGPDSVDGARPGVVLVSAVAGLPGVGKTEVALQAAHRALARGWFPGGALMVDMHGYEAEPKRLDPDRALGGLLRALGVPDQYIPPETQERERLYRAVLAEYAEQGRPILVVIDNASSGDQAAPLLPGSGAAIVTSRHTLAGLDARLFDLDTLPDSDAAELLTLLLHRRRGDAERRVAEEPHQARRLVDFCAGLPLAVEIIAAPLAAHPAKPLAVMADELAAEHTRLAELRYEQKAVRAAFDLSYRNLDEEQARLFRLLTVNPGPEVSTEAAAALAELEERQVRRLLEALARAHLIEPAGGYGRWRMHDLVRLYATGLAEESADEDERFKALARLLEYYLTTSWNASAHLIPAEPDPAAHGFDDQDLALKWLDTELPNLMAACRTCIERAPSTGILMIRSLGRFLAWRGHFKAWTELAALAVRTARSIGDRTAESKALSALTSALVGVQRYEEAIASAQRAVALCREAGNGHEVAMILGNMAVALLGLQRYEEAIDASRNAGALLRETGDQHGEAVVLGILGRILLKLEQFDEAITASRDAALVLRETRDLRSAGLALIDLGMALNNARRFKEAIPVYQDAVAILADTDDRARQGMALAGLWFALLRTGQRDAEAAAVGRKAVTIYRETGDRQGEGDALNALGAALNQLARIEEAINVTGAAIAIFRETGDQLSEAVALNNLGLALAGAGQFSEAINTYLDAAEIFLEVGEPHATISTVINLRTALAELLRSTTDTPTA